MAKKVKKVKARDLLLKWAWENKRNAAGPHTDLKKEKDRLACRGKIHAPFSFLVAVNKLFTTEKVTPCDLPDQHKSHIRIHNDRRAHHPSIS